MGQPIDLNSDLGESWGAYTMGVDAAVLSIVTSANVACRFRAGDPHVGRLRQRAVVLGQEVAAEETPGVVAECVRLFLEVGLACY